MTWLHEEATNPQGIQQQYPTPNRETVPMAEQEARASRFVSQQGVPTVRPVLPQPNRVERQWQAEDPLPPELKQQGVQLRLRLWAGASLERRNDPENLQR